MNRQPPTSRKNTRRLRFQSLEDRRLMAGDVSMDQAGVVTIEATAEDDVVVVAAQGDQLRVRVNDVVKKFTIDQATRIMFDGMKGDDIFRNHTHIDVDVSGGAGHDMLTGGSGNDIIRGGQGDDQIAGRDGDDQLNGGAGNDRLVGGEGADNLSGEEDDDRIYGEAGDDAISGGEGDDALFGGAGMDRMFGDDGDDRMHGGAGDDEMDGGAGRDLLFGEIGDDWLQGGVDDDRLWGDEGADTIDGGEHNDRITGDAQDQPFNGRAGRDSLLYIGSPDSDAPRMEGFERLLIGGESLATQVRLSDGQVFIFDTPTAGRRIDARGQSTPFHNVELVRDPNRYAGVLDGLVAGTSMAIPRPENKTSIGIYRTDIVNIARSPGKWNAGHVQIHWVEGQFQFRLVYLYGTPS